MDQNATQSATATIDLRVIRADGRVEPTIHIGSHETKLWRRVWSRAKQRWEFLWENPELGAIVVVNGGQAVVTNRVIQAGTAPKNIGWGTGAGTSAITDSSLFTEKLVDLSTSAGTDHTVGTESRTTTTVTNDTYTVTGTRTATGPGTVTNAGLFDAASGGNLYVKGDMSITLATSDAIAFTFNVKFS